MMNRKDFLKTVGIGTTGLTLAPTMLFSRNHGVKELIIRNGNLFDNSRRYSGLRDYRLNQIIKGVSHKMDLNIATHPAMMIYYDCKDELEPYEQPIVMKTQWVNGVEPFSISGFEKIYDDNFIRITDKTSINTILNGVIHTYLFEKNNKYTDVYYIYDLSYIKVIDNKYTLMIRGGRKRVDSKYKHIRKDNIK